LTKAVLNSTQQAAQAEASAPLGVRQGENNTMRVHLINPSDVSFGISVITPRWLYVLASATPREFGDPHVVDETLELIDPEEIQAGDIVGIGIHTSNALRGYALGRIARERGAYVVFGGIHATLFPEESYERGGAHSVVKGDGDVVWGQAVTDCVNGNPKPLYDGGRVESDQFLPARWDLMPEKSYLFASVQTVRGCPKHCSFCSVWRTDGQQPRQRNSDIVIQEIIELRRLGFKIVVLADDNFYPVTLEDLRLAKEQKNEQRLAELTALRDERFELMQRMADLPNEMMFFTQITMEAAEDPEFLDAMMKAHIRGALVGVESVTPEGLKAVFKDFNQSGESLVNQLQTFRKHGLHVLGSFIFGLPTDRPDTFDSTVTLAQAAGVTFAQFVTMTPFPGTVDFMRWEKEQAADPQMVDGIPLTRYWLIPRHLRPRLYIPHPTMSVEQIRQQTHGAWKRYYSFPLIWKRARGCTKRVRARTAFILISKLYLEMYGNTGIATDSARIGKAAGWARWLAKKCLPLFRTTPMPELKMPDYAPSQIASATHAEQEQVV